MTNQKAAGIGYPVSVLRRIRLSRLKAAPTIYSKELLPPAFNSVLFNILYIAVQLPWF
jgi:hypothetical protein